MQTGVCLRRSGENGNIWHTRTRAKYDNTACWVTASFTPSATPPSLFLHLASAKAKGWNGAGWRERGRMTRHAHMFSQLAGKEPLKLFFQEPARSSALSQFADRRADARPEKRTLNLKKHYMSVYIFTTYVHVFMFPLKQLTSQKKSRVRKLQLTRKAWHQAT